MCGASLSAKRELLLSFFAAELFFFLHSPFDFDFVSEMETDGQERSSSNFRKVLHKRTHRTTTHLSFQKVRKLRAKVTDSLFARRTYSRTILERRSRKFRFASLIVGSSRAIGKGKNFRRLKKEEAFYAATPPRNIRALFTPLRAIFGAKGAKMSSRCFRCE